MLTLPAQRAPLDWPTPLVTALHATDDHPDAVRLWRVRDVLAEARETIRRIAGECETSEVRAALTEGVDSTLSVIDDTTINLTCVLDAWNDERDWRDYGNEADRRRQMAAE